MDSLLKKFFASSVITSVTLLLLGMLLIFQSEATIIAITYIIGAILGILGIFKFIKSLNDVNKEELNMVYGVVTIILGILVIKNPHAIASILPIVIGIGIIINSATKLQYAFELKAIDNSLWKSTLIVSIVSTIFGVVLLFNPFKGAELITKIVGILIALYAILDIISTFTIRKNVKEIHKTIEQGIIDAEVVEEQENIEEETKAKNSKSKKKNKKEKKWYNMSNFIFMALNLSKLIDQWNDKLDNFVGKYMDSPWVGSIALGALFIFAYWGIKSLSSK